MTRKIEHFNAEGAEAQRRAEKTYIEKFSSARLCASAPSAFNIVTFRGDND